MNLEISYDNLCACVEQQLLRQFGHIHDGEDVKITFDNIPVAPVKLTLEVTKIKDKSIDVNNATEKTQLS